MRNNIWTLLISIILFSCGQSGKVDRPLSTKQPLSDSVANLLPKPSNPNDSLFRSRNEDLKDEFQNFKIYDLKSPIVADLNGDKIDDRAIFSTINSQSGILITDGKTKQITRIGFGKALDEMTSLNWVNYWGLLRDTITTKVKIDEISGGIIGGFDYKLDNVSLFVRIDASEDASGGGVITFKGDKYVWVHQSE